MTIDFLKIIELIKDPDLRMKISTLYEENIALREENHSLKEKFSNKKEVEKIKSKLEYRENHYFLEQEGPFCTRCWDVDNKLVRIHVTGPDYGVTYYKCPSCKTEMHTGQFIQPNNPRDFDLF